MIKADMIRVIAHLLMKEKHEFIEDQLVGFFNCDSIPNCKDYEDCTECNLTQAQKILDRLNKS